MFKDYVNNNNQLQNSFQKHNISSVRYTGVGSAKYHAFPR